LKEISTVLSKWNDHYERKQIEIREGNEAKIWLQQKPSKNSIVLLHGLTDSPHFVFSIGSRFFERGFNVFMPLLPSHGLINHNHMKDASLSQWRDEVSFCVGLADSLGARVSIGGLSLGGALALEFAVKYPVKIDGGLFLYSAAMDLKGRKGDLAENALRQKALVSPLANRQDKKGKDMIGPNPFRYGRMDFDGAGQLARLIGDINKHYVGRPRYGDITQPTFIAHSESDPTADITDLEKLERNHPKSTTSVDFFRIPKALNLRHASVVLEHDIYGPGEDGSPQIVEPRNPLFEEMMLAQEAFLEKHF